MKTTAAVLHQVGKPLEIEDVELDRPAEGEVLVRFTHAGLCHSDLHAMRGELTGYHLPMVMGHEGSGVVEETGPGVTRVRPGDHVVCSFIPNCGVCRWCATGQQAICDWGAGLRLGHLPGGHWTVSGRDGDYGLMCLLGTFSQYGVVHQNSAVRIDPDIPLDVAALVGCGVPTGWGSATNAADVRAGDTVIVYGVGGIGVNAVQGARFAGAKHVVAVDPVELKRDTALDLGATHAVVDAAEAQRLVTDLTRGVGAEKAIITTDLATEQIVSDAFATIGKAGTVVVTALSPVEDRTISVPGAIATLWKKTIKGTLFGDCNPTTDIPRLLGLYQSGDLKLDELITRRYRLDEVNQGYDDLHHGRNIRGLIVHDHS